MKCFYEYTFSSMLAFFNTRRPGSEHKVINYAYKMALAANGHLQIFSRHYQYVSGKGRVEQEPTLVASIRDVRGDAVFELLIEPHTHWVSVKNMLMAFMNGTVCTDAKRYKGYTYPLRFRRRAAPYREGTVPVGAGTTYNITRQFVVQTVADTREVPDKVADAPIKEFVKRVIMVFVTTYKMGGYKDMEKTPYNHLYYRGALERVDLTDLSVENLGLVAEAAYTFVFPYTAKPSAFVGFWTTNPHGAQVWARKSVPEHEREAAHVRRLKNNIRKHLLDKIREANGAYELKTEGE